MGKTPDLDEPLIDFFQKANINAIHRVLERATANANRAAKAASARARGSTRTGPLTRAFNKAMSAHGRAAKNRASIRQTAPDTGGRPYHFGYSTITRNSGAPGGPGAQAAPAAGTRPRARPPSATGEGAHQIYIERDGAIDPNSPAISASPVRSAAPGQVQARDTPEREPAAEASRDGPGQSPGQEIDGGTGHGATHAANAHAKAEPIQGAAPTRQKEHEAALEPDPGLGPDIGRNPEAGQTRQAPLHGTEASFGTIAATKEGRLAFWTMIAGIDPATPDAPGQAQVTLDLPPNLDPQAKHDHIRRYCQTAYEANGIPYWAAIHLPVAGQKGSRLTQAHIVATTHPLDATTDPATGAFAWIAPRSMDPSPSPQAHVHPDAQAWTASVLAEHAGTSAGASAVAAQLYIEDPAKTSLHGTQDSFGTIGATLDERLRFWELVHEHESVARDGRTQTRLVLELPHEASAQARHDIVRRFCETEFTQKGIPFWASIHVPSHDNDARNFHAHIVCGGRPMEQIRDPATGQVAWDFTVEEHYKRANRANAVRFPYRQNRDPAMRQRTYVKEARTRFSTIVNDVMVEYGTEVRYDPRSYKDMGLDVAPMRNVSRILADKLDKRSFVVMDAEWTRKMIDAEIQAAAARRDQTFVKLQETETQIQDAARTAHRSAKAMARLPQALRTPSIRTMRQATADRIVAQVLSATRDRLAQQFADQSIMTALDQIVAATAPGTRRNPAARVHDTASAPDPADLAALHEAAIEERRVQSLGAKSRMAAMREAERRPTREWHAGHAPATPATPAAPSPPQAARAASQTRPTPQAAWTPAAGATSPRPPWHQPPTAGAFGYGATPAKSASAQKPAASLWQPRTASTPRTAPGPVQTATTPPPNPAPAMRPARGELIVNGKPVFAPGSLSDLVFKSGQALVTAFIASMKNDQADKSRNAQPTPDGQAPTATSQQPSAATKGADASVVTPKPSPNPAKAAESAATPAAPHAKPPVAGQTVATAARAAAPTRPTEPLGEPLARAAAASSAGLTPSIPQPLPPPPQATPDPIAPSPPPRPLPPPRQPPAPYMPARPRTNSERAGLLAGRKDVPLASKKPAQDPVPRPIAPNGSPIQPTLDIPTLFTPPPPPARPQPSIRPTDRGATESETGRDPTPTTRPAPPSPGAGPTIVAAAASQAAPPHPIEAAIRLTAVPPRRTVPPAAAADAPAPVLSKPPVAAAPVAAPTPSPTRVKPATNPQSQLQFTAATNQARQAPAARQAHPGAEVDQSKPSPPAATPTNPPREAVVSASAAGALTALPTGTPPTETEVAATLEAAEAEAKIKAAKLRRRRALLAARRANDIGID